MTKKSNIFREWINEYWWIGALIIVVYIAACRSFGLGAEPAAAWAQAIIGGAAIIGTAAITFGISQQEYQRTIDAIAEEKRERLRKISAILSSSAVPLLWFEENRQWTPKQRAISKRHFQRIERTVKFIESAPLEMPNVTVAMRMARFISDLDDISEIADLDPLSYGSFKQATEISTMATKAVQSLMDLQQEFNRAFSDRGTDARTQSQKVE